MKTVKSKVPSEGVFAPKNGTDQESCLLVATNLNGYVAFVRERVVGGRDLGRDGLVNKWNDASVEFDRLASKEGGIADAPIVLPLPVELKRHVDKLVRVPSFQRAFSNVPIAFGMVPLRQIIAYQPFVTESSVAYVSNALGSNVRAQTLGRMCLPTEPARTPYQLARQEGNRFVFVSDNHDGRFLGAQLLNGAELQQIAFEGHAQAVLALGFGFTTNVLNVIRYQNRLVLNNGYHRALAMARMGLTHAPCLIQVCRSWDEVQFVGAGDISARGELFFDAPRPPLLKDYTNRQLTQVFTTYRLRKEIRVTYHVDTLKLAI